MYKVTFLSSPVDLGSFLGKRRTLLDGWAILSHWLRGMCCDIRVSPHSFQPLQISWLSGCRPESLCSVMCDTAGGGRRLILSLFKITSTHWDESLERHCLGFCISLKNIPRWSFPLSVACLFPHSGSLKRRLRGSGSQLLLSYVPEFSLCTLPTTRIHMLVQPWRRQVLRKAVPPPLHTREN